MHLSINKQCFNRNWNGTSAQYINCETARIDYAKAQLVPLKLTKYPMLRIIYARVVSTRQNNKFNWMQSVHCKKNTHQLQLYSNQITSSQLFYCGKICLHMSRNNFTLKWIADRLRWYATAKTQLFWLALLISIHFFFICWCFAQFNSLYIPNSIGVHFGIVFVIELSQLLWLTQYCQVCSNWIQAI